MKPIYQGELILTAFEQLIPLQPQVRFIMFSAGYEVSGQVRQKAIELGEKYPNFYYEFGLIPREEVIELWSLVDIFISAPIYDGYSNAVAEGRYAGAIPVVNGIPGNKEILEHKKTAFFVEPFTADNLANTLQKVLSNTQQHKKDFHQVSLPWILQYSELNKNIQAFIRLAGR